MKFYFSWPLPPSSLLCLASSGTGESINFEIFSTYTITHHPHNIEINISSFSVIIHFISFVFLHCLVLKLLYVAKHSKNVKRQTTKSIWKPLVLLLDNNAHLAWRIPETEEPSGLPSMGSHRVGHD